MLAELNFERFADWLPPFNPRTARPALLAFNGDVYQGMNASETFDERDYTHAQKVLLHPVGALRSAATTRFDAALPTGDGPERRYRPRRRPVRVLVASGSQTCSTPISRPAPARQSW